MNIIRDSNAWSHERIVLNHGELRHIAVTVNLNVIADLAAIVDRRAVPDVEVVPYLVLFADRNIVAAGKAAADDRSTIDHSAVADARAITDLERVIGDLSARAIAELYAFVYLSIPTEYDPGKLYLLVQERYPPAMVGVAYIITAIITSSVPPNSRQCAESGDSSD